MNRPRRKTKPAPLAKPPANDNARPPKIGSPEFRALQAEWYRKLADAGFDDQEDEHGRLSRGLPKPGRHDLGLPEHPAIVPLHLANESQVSGSIWELSARYDHLAAAVWRFPFETELDREICRRLSEGESYRDIVDALRVGEHRIKRVARAVLRWTDPDDADGRS